MNDDRRLGIRIRARVPLNSESRAPGHALSFLTQVEAG
jgi:hypothetical protein